MATFASSSGNFLLNLLKGITDPFRRGIGTGQQAIAQKRGISPEQLAQRAQSLSQQGGLAGILGKLSQATQLKPEESRELQQKPALSLGKTLAGQGAFFVPAAKGAKLAKGASKFQKALALTKAGAKVGAATGGLAGFGASKQGEELESTVGGIGIGAVFGVGTEFLGKFSQKLGAIRKAKKLAKAKGVDTGIVGKKLKNDPFFLKNRTQLRQTGTSLGFKKGQTPTQKLELVQDAFDQLDNNTTGLLKGADPINEDTLLDDFIRNLDETQFDDATPGDKRFLTGLVTRLEKASGDNLKLNQLKSTLRKELGGVFDKAKLTPKDQAKMALFKGIKESFDGISPEIRKANNFQKQLFDIADELGKNIKGGKNIKIKLPIGGDVPLPVSKQAVEALGGKTQNLLGGILGLPGQAVGAVAGTTAKVTGQPQARAGILNQILQAGGGQQQPQQVEAQVPTQPTTQPQVDETQLSPETQSALATVRQAREQAQGGGAGVGGVGEIRITSEQAVLAQLTLPPKQAAAIQRAFQTQQSAIEFEQKQQVAQAKLAGGGTLSASERKTKLLGQSGIRALDEIDEILLEDPSVFLKAALPGKLGTTTRKYDSASFRAVEGLLRARSGAAVPETEVRRYVDANLPKFGDSQEAAKFKLDAFRKDLEAVANIGEPGGTPGTGQNDVAQLLQALGLDPSSL